MTWSQVQGAEAPRPDTRRMYVEVENMGRGCAPLMALRLSSLRCDSDIVGFKLFVVQVLYGLAIDPHLLLSLSVLE